MSVSKRCTRCGKTKPLDEFRLDKGKPDGRRSLCRDCAREADRLYRAANRERVAAAGRAWRLANAERVRGYPLDVGKARASWRRWDAKLKRAVFGHYGTSCACCGSTEKLTIDHVNGDGAQHRAEIGRQGGSHLYIWLVANGYPDGFQTLCGPCNRSKGNGPQCRLSHPAA